MSKVCVLVPAYRRPEYTLKCIQSIESAQEYKDVTFYLIDDGSGDGTAEIFRKAKLNSVVIIHPEQQGLRNTIIDFIEEVRVAKPDYIAKIDNDCTVPKDWLNHLLSVMKEHDVDVLSPNTSETNAAHKYGFIAQRKGAFIPSQIVGGLWCMKASMVDDIYFERVGTSGIRGAFHIISQIVIEKEPKIGWTDKVTYGDIGFWSGSHPEHIKSKDHALYSAEVGRPITWNPKD